MTTTLFLLTAALTAVSKLAGPAQELHQFARPILSVETALSLEQSSVMTATIIGMMAAQPNARQKQALHAQEQLQVRSQVVLKSVGMGLIWAICPAMTQMLLILMVALKLATQKTGSNAVEEHFCLETGALRFGMMDLTMGIMSVIKETLTMLMGVTSLEELSLDGTAMMADLGPLMYAGTGAEMEGGCQQRSVMIIILINLMLIQLL